MKKPLSEMSLKELHNLFPINLIEHQERWGMWYNEEADMLQEALTGKQIIRISHVGSTAIKGIWAKPIIDILVEIPTDCDMSEIKESILNSGYICMSESENRISFNKGYTENGFAERIVHLHLRYAGDNDDLYFKDYLNENPIIAKQYEKLKLTLWKKYEHNRDEYTEKKREFISLYTQKAKKEYGSRYCMPLTDKGWTENAGTSKATVNNEFSNKIGRLIRSGAYLNYCEEVSGYRVYLFNMMDKQQIDFVLSSIPVSAEDTILDLGCGPGSILNLLVNKYGCRGIGVDQLDSDILERNGKAFTYVNGDIDRISDYSLKPTITLSIDSLYFSNDLDKLVRQLKSIENNRMYLFYSQYIFDEACVDKSILHSHNMNLADALNKNNISYETIDYSENERLLYENSLRVLKKYKKAFEDEGNLDLYEQKLKEDRKGLELYEKNRASRYLYIIDGV